MPKWYPPHPCPRNGSTRVIANNSGHLLPGIKKSKNGPWGNYVGTWEHPNYITREYGKEWQLNTGFPLSSGTALIFEFGDQSNADSGYC